AIEARGDLRLVPAEGGAQGVGDGAGRRRISEVFPEDELAGADRAAEALAGDAAAAQALIGPGRQVEGDGEGGAAAVVADVTALVQSEGPFAGPVDQRALARLERPGRGVEIRHPCH